METLGKFTVPFSNIFQHFPPFFLVAKQRKMGIDSPSHDMPPPKVHLGEGGGGWPKNFPFFHQQQKKIPTLPHFPPFPHIFLALSHL